MDEVVVLISVLLLVSITVGLILAIAGRLTPVAFFMPAVPATLGLWWFMRFQASASSSHHVRWWVATLVVLVALIPTFLNVSSSAEHLQTNRDPGVYLTTGKWVADNGTLLIDGANRGFSASEAVSGWTGGYYDSREDGLLYAQFNHGFPVVLALSNWIGGDRLMFNLNPLIGAAFVLMLFLLLRRFFEDWIALIATSATAFNLVFWHFTRDTYSEPLVALLLVLALIATDRAIVSGTLRNWMFAGALVGSTALVRIDAWFYVAVFAGLIAVQSLLPITNVRQRLRIREALGALVAAWTLGVVGYADLALRSPGYLADLWERVRLMFMSAAVVGVIAVVVIVVGGLAPGILNRLHRMWLRLEQPLRWLGAAVVVTFFIWAMFWRPKNGIMSGSQPGLVTGLMDREGIPADATRSFHELSARWLSWYWGLPALIVAVVGWTLTIGRRSIEGRGRFYVPLTLMGLSIVPYIIEPSIAPDQLWALRRFYPMALIGFPVAVGAALMMFVVWLRRWSQRWIEPLVGSAAALAVVLVPVVYAAPLATASTQVGMYGSTMQLCAALPADATVLVEAGRLATVFPAAIRSFCGVPVASLEPGAGKAEIDAVAAAWKERGRSLYVVGPPDACVIGGSPMASSQFRFTLPERTISYRPSQLINASFGWELGIWGDTVETIDSGTTWTLEIRTDWAPPDSSSIIATEGNRSDARWWLEYRPTGIVEFWVNTSSGPVGVGYPVPLDDAVPRTIPFGWEGETIFIGCGVNLRSTATTGIVHAAGLIETGKTYDGAFGNWEFVGAVEVRPSE